MFLHFFLASPEHASPLLVAHVFALLSHAHEPLHFFLLVKLAQESSSVAAAVVVEAVGAGVVSSCGGSVVVAAVVVEAVGAGVGTAVGFCVGTAVGFSVGTAVGFSVGTAVGEVVGATVVAKQAQSSKSQLSRHWEKKSSCSKHWKPALQ